MTMLTANSATAIIVAAIFAMCFLNETWMWKYDLPAIIFLILGSVTIVLQSNTEDKRRDRGRNLPGIVNM